MMMLLLLGWLYLIPYLHIQNYKLFYIDIWLQKVVDCLQVRGER